MTADRGIARFGHRHNARFGNLRRLEALVHGETKDHSEFRRDRVFQITQRLYRPVLHRLVHGRGDIAAFRRFHREHSGVVGPQWLWAYTVGVDYLNAVPDDGARIA